MSTTKTKKAQGGARGKASTTATGRIPRDIKERAERIIETDTVKHPSGRFDTADIDTRRAVENMLKNYNVEPTEQWGRQLTEYVETAEAGGVIREYSKHLDAQLVEGATTIIGLLDAPLPDYVGGLITLLLTTIERRTGIELWRSVGDGTTVDDCGYSVGALAAAFERHPELGLEFEPKKDLAGLISAVLTHSDTPTRVFNALSEAVGELAARDEVTHAPEVLRVALAVRDAEEKGGEQ